jgi:hypothetical protein
MFVVELHEFVMVFRERTLGFDWSVDLRYLIRFKHKLSINPIPKFEQDEELHPRNR